MIKLVYDIRCGFKQLYMTEKDVEWFLDGLFDPNASNWDDDEPQQTAEDFYKESQHMTQSELEEYFTDIGVLGIIEEHTEEDYANTYFKDVCTAQNCVPGFTKIYNLRVEYDPTIEVRFCKNATADYLEPHYYKDGIEVDLDNVNQYNPWMKAGEVMELLGISRKVLSTYVKKGLIKTEPNYTGKQYRYDRESVLALKKKH